LTGNTAATPTATPATTPAAGAPAATTPAAPTGTTSSAAILAAIKAKVPASIVGTAQGPDTWDYYLMQAYPSYVAPAPEDEFPGKANVREPVTIETWFQALFPLLPAAGLKGTRAGLPAGLPTPSRLMRRSARMAWTD
jgi:hypothetical protein